MKTTQTTMKAYKVISAKNQGVYSKDELIQIIRTDNIAGYFGLADDKEFDLAKIAYVGENAVKIGQE